MRNGMIFYKNKSVFNFRNIFNGYIIKASVIKQVSRLSYTPFLTN